MLLLMGRSLWLFTYNFTLMNGRLSGRSMPISMNRLFLFWLRLLHGLLSLLLLLLLLFILTHRIKNCTYDHNDNKRNNTTHRLSSPSLGIHRVSRQFYTYEALFIAHPLNHCHLDYIY